MTPASVVSGFFRTGMFPFDPEAHKHFDASRLGSLGGLPLLVSSKDDLLRAPSISSLVQSCDDAVPPTPPPKAKRQCPLKLSTEAGLLLTSEETLALIQAKQTEKEAAVAAKAAKKEAKAAKASAKAAEKEAKATATAATKAARVLAKAEKEAAKAARGKKRKAEGDAAVNNGDPVTAPTAPLLPVLLSAAVIAEAMAKKGPGALEARQRKVEQRERERAAAALLAVGGETERPALPLSDKNDAPRVALRDESNRPARGHKRKAAQAAESGKENTPSHSHNTRAKAARTLQPVLNKTS
jgi:hypothetical protein